jgi:hypothetical protein
LTGLFEKTRLMRSGDGIGRMRISSAIGFLSVWVVVISNCGLLMVMRGFVVVG